LKTANDLQLVVFSKTRYPKYRRTIFGRRLAWWPRAGSGLGAAEDLRSHSMESAWMSNTGGQYPIWSLRGHDFFCSEDDRRILVIDYSSQGNSFAPGAVRIWLDQVLADVPWQNYDVRLMGKRIIAAIPAKAPESSNSRSPVVFPRNFFDELRRRVPAQTNPASLRLPMPAPN
jgi:hypothetical protein